MDRLEAMQVFVQVAERASFAEAARRLAMSPARVTRAVALLEARCGAQLLHRTTRVVRLSSAGERYLAQCKLALAVIEDAEAAVASEQRELSGQLSLTAPVLFGHLHVTPLLFDFMQEHPKLNARVLFSDRVLDLYEQQIEVAIRIALLPDSGLRAVRVGEVRRVVCAAPAYLRAHGTPEHPHALQDHASIALMGAGGPQAWSFVVAGQRESITPKPRFVVNSSELAIAAARAGHGLIRVLSYQVERDVREKRLRVVLADYETERVPVHLVHVAGRTASRRVRAFVDWMVAGLRVRLQQAALP